ncbi:GNAT family N-acetyltransferase [Chloroflexi bacterium CFX6]|nr:GNAT family N-acetyltransferase [Chloroflexi bacterium CFX6]
MSAVTIPVQNKDHPHMRAMNMFRDLNAVADLIELCFASTMDNDGQRYVNDMRRASRDDGFLRWASNMTENASLPLTGFVWEENGRIVGNASLIPFRERGKRIYLIANIAVHPDHRRRGIARVLTQRAMKYGWDKRASALWLHVRDDNPGAIELYRQLGFKEVARRATWVAKTSPPSLSDSDIQIVPRHPRFWLQQQDWLRRLHPDVLGWYRSFNLNSLRPGLMNWLYLLFVDVNIKQWAAVRGDRLLATLSWAPRGGRSDSLFAAAGADADEGGETSAEALALLLLHARRTLSNRSTLSLEYPAGEMTEAFLAAGFTERRTLIWMRAEPATRAPSLRK